MVKNNNLIFLLHLIQRGHFALWAKLAMILIVIYVPTTSLKSCFLLTTIFILIMAQSHIKPYLTKEMNKVERRTFWAVAVILFLEVARSQVGLEYSLIFTILILSIKIFNMLYLLIKFAMYKSLDSKILEKSKKLTVISSKIKSNNEINKYINFIIFCLK